MKEIESDLSIIVCRCEEITEKEILRALRAGCRTVTDIKRYCRAGMGLCQGRTCGPIIRDLIFRELEHNLGEIIPGEFIETPRFPLSPVELDAFRHRYHRST